VRVCEEGSFWKVLLDLKPALKIGEELADRMRPLVWVEKCGRWPFSI